VSSKAVLQHNRLLLTILKGFNKMIYRLFLMLFILVIHTSSAFSIGDDVPQWFQQATTLSVPSYKKDVPAVVLLDQATSSIDEDGRITTTAYYVLKILNAEGRGFAIAREQYNTDSGKIRELKAWLIRPDGKVKKYGKDETVDVGVGLDDIYNDSRARIIDASDDAEIGAIFGYQSISEERLTFPETAWQFQSRLPTIISRYTVNIPKDWTVSSTIFNNAKIEPMVAASSYTWELKDLKPIEPEIASPSVKSLAPILAVRYKMPKMDKLLAGNHSFDSWKDISLWYTNLSEPQSAPDEKIIAKTKELTANCKTEFERIQAIGRYVQNLQYVSVQIGIGGYRPHAATQVFAKAYGDCKDKANLMRAMLKTINITSYPVLIYSGDRTHVRKEWASPTQFNHCIIAVKLSEPVEAISVVEHANLGKLLIFDATDNDTPVGDLPDHEQGSFALIAAGETGTILQMPFSQPEANRWERKVELNIAENGSIIANVKDQTLGQSAVKVRRLFNNRNRTDFTKAIERWISIKGVTGAKLSKVEPVDNHNKGHFALDVEFSADRYAQSLQNRMLIFKPTVIGYSNEYLELTETSRKHPIVIEPESFNETVSINIPTDFKVDEIPDPVAIETIFGSYITKYEIKDTKLIFTRKLVQRPAIVEPNKYADVRKFMNSISSSETAPIVLVRK
jgi:transglutaminase-like putative cysteine protease